MAGICTASLACDDGHACTTNDQCDVSGVCGGELSCPAPNGALAYPSAADVYLEVGRYSFDGGQSDTSYPLFCGSGYVATGIEGSPEPWVIDPFVSVLGTFRFQCSRPLLTARSDGIGYDLNWSEAWTVWNPILGTSSTGAPIEALDCPPDQFLVGLRATHNLVIGDMQIQCAPLIVEESASGYTVRHGTVTAVSGSIGGDPAATDSGEQNCAEDSVAIGGYGMVDSVSTSIQGVSMRCRKIHLTEPVSLARSGFSTDRTGTGAFNDECAPGMIMTGFQAGLSSGSIVHGSARCATLYKMSGVDAVVASVPTSATPQRGAANAATTTTLYCGGSSNGASYRVNARTTYTDDGMGYLAGLKLDCRELTYSAGTVDVGATSYASAWVGVEPTTSITLEGGGPTLRTGRQGYESASGIESIGFGTPYSTGSYP